jgi:hypothetical protein
MKLTSVGAGNRDTRHPLDSGVLSSVCPGRYEAADSIGPDRHGTSPRIAGERWMTMDSRTNIHLSELIQAV